MSVELRFRLNLSALAFLLLLVGCDDAKPPATGSGGSATVEPTDDRHSATFRSQTVPELLQQNYEARGSEFAEARRWLGDEKHVSGKLPRDTAKKLVEQLYAAGAQKVFAADFKTEGDVVTAESLIALVPTVQPEVRDRVVAVRDEHYRTYLPTVGKAGFVAELTKVEAVPAVVLIGLDY